MEDFIKKFSNVPKNFIDDFFIFSKDTKYQNYDDLTINFDNIVSWLDISKDTLKESLLSNFEQKYDFIIDSNNLETENEKIFVTPNCFKELCTINQTTKGKELRKYFISIEKMIKKYEENPQKILDSAYIKFNNLENINLDEYNYNEEYDFYSMILIVIFIIKIIVIITFMSKLFF